ncbi:hypothetical protein [Dactylosporangium sp. CA-139066]
MRRVLALLLACAALVFAAPAAQVNAATTYLTDTLVLAEVRAFVSG